MHGWTVVQTTDKERILFASYPNREAAIQARDSFRRLDKSMKRKPSHYAVINFGNRIPRETSRTTRKRNPTRKGKATRKGKPSKAKTETTTTNTKSVKTRKVNPRSRRPPQFAMVAQATGRRKIRLRYTGTRFTSHGRPVLFDSMAQVRNVAKDLRRKFGHRLRKYSLFAEARPNVKT